MSSMILERYVGKRVTVATVRGNFSGLFTQSGEQYVIEGETFAPNEIKNIIWT